MYFLSGINVYFKTSHYYVKFTLGHMLKMEVTVIAYGASGPLGNFFFLNSTGYEDHHKFLGQ